MPIKDFDTFKTVLDEYLGAVTEVEDSCCYEGTKLLIIKANKDKPILLKLSVSDFGDGWQIGGTEWSFRMKDANKVFRNYKEVE